MAEQASIRWFLAFSNDKSDKNANCAKSDKNDRPLKGAYYFWIVNGIGTIQDSV